MAAWFVSNCHTTNDRMAVAKGLQSFGVQVDIYGSCGPLKCPRKPNEAECRKLLQRDYKFYLAFENSNCRDYITEKLFSNALEYDVLPIVMGGRPEDYRRLIPERSYIHVDDFDSVEHLAKYLLLLNEDNELYNSYFQWKGTGEFIDTHFWCRVCAVLHASDERDKQYRSMSNIKDFNTWWAGNDVCQAGSWKKFDNEQL